MVLCARIFSVLTRLGRLEVAKSCLNMRKCLQPTEQRTCKRVQKVCFAHALHEPFAGQPVHDFTQFIQQAVVTIEFEEVNCMLT